MVIGSFQSLRNEVDPEGAARHGIEVVWRISGGGAMFVEPGNTITYSLSVPEALVQGLSFQDSYAYLDSEGAVARGLPRSGAAGSAMGQGLASAWPSGRMSSACPLIDTLT